MAPRPIWDLCCGRRLEWVVGVIEPVGFEPPLVSERWGTGYEDTSDSEVIVRWFTELRSVLLGNLLARTRHTTPTLKAVVDREMVRVPPSTFRLSPSFPPEPRSH